MLSIVHVLSSYGVGGQERVALDLAIGQRARGHRVGVLSLAPPPDGAMADELSSAGAEVGRVPKRDGGIDPSLVVRLARELRARKADVVHTHNPLPLVYGAPAARLIGAAAIHTKHGKNPSGRANLLLRRAAARFAHAFVAVSDTTAVQAREQREMPESRLHVIPNGIRLDRYAPDSEARAAIRMELGLGDAWVVGTVGRLDPFKNQVLLIRAMAPLLGSGVRLVIVGEGDERPALEAEIAKLGAASAWVVMTGRRMDVPRVVHAFDVFALSSKSEGLPLVVPEAMAAGLPIVATAVGGLPDVIDAQTGILVPVEQAALTAALVQLERDREQAKAIGARGREVALARYSHDRMVDDYLTLYRNART